MVCNLQDIGTHNGPYISADFQSLNTGEPFDVGICLFRLFPATEHVTEWTDFADLCFPPHLRLIARRLPASTGPQCSYPSMPVGVSVPALTHRKSQ
ncbi:hypothetical protein ElyMa_003571900 [Elysia marginata]|uniref:Uncharacterized protein n=1 Tax=Elysia marginata TaxID=1093978 RepID=A0AAV4EMB5_9GAST|nr:hypothetical protein ElyMa_003571900 [Elysia marginata]